MRIVAVILIVLGILGLAYGGFNVVYPEKVVDIGPLELSVDKERSFPVPPVLGVFAILGGIGLLFLDRKRG